MKFEVLKSLISETENIKSLNTDLETYRIFCIIATIAVPSFWFFHKLNNPHVIDFIVLRLIIACFFCSVFVGSYLCKPIRENIVFIVESSYYGLIAWLLYLNYLNGFSDHAIALLITIFGIMVLGLKSYSNLVLYPVTTIILTGFTCIFVANPELDKILLISNLSAVSLISYIISRSKLKAQEEIAVREELMSTIFNESADALFLLNPDNQEIVSCNDQALSLFERNKKELIGINIAELQKKDKDFDIRSKIENYGVFYNQGEYITKNGKKSWSDLVIKKISIASQSLLLARISDITERKQAEEALQQAKDELERRVEERTAELLQSNLLLKQEIGDRQQAEEQLAHSAFHDALTGLPNRALFVERLGQAVERAKWYEGYLFAVLFLDLDRFKVINDSLGHMAGDQLLLAIASRIKACLRLEDLVARIGGDEFTILLEGIRDVNEAKGVANRIQEQLKLPFNLSGNEVFTSASIGIALSVTGYDKPEQILRDADMAMYKAKMCGKARHEVFDITMHSAAVARLQMETDLRRAIERQEFRLHYQPIISLDSGKINGFEALVRWQHPENGLVSPAEFMPLVEETGLIVALGWWVIREACSQMQVWQAQFLANPLTISVNISGRQFSELDLSQRIEQILQEYRLDPRSLKLEITESAIVENPESAAVMLAQLRKLGIQLCMDDFGTGYSSLSYLHRFPIDMLKIDRSFVSRMSFDNEDSEIVRTIVTLAHNLGMNVTAEGVETAEQVALLKKINCEYGQGYFFSKPIDSEAATALIPILGIG